MSDDPTVAAARMAAAAAVMGSVARLAMALQGGSRGWRLLVEGLVGGALGVIAAGVAVWWDPALRDAGWPLLIVAGFAGLAGALGTKALEIAAAIIERRVR
jgi:hypothetical protein